MVSRPAMPAIPVELLPRPRLIVWHGEPGDDPATDNALAVIRRTYHGVIGHGVVTGGRTAGGNDWSGWHFPDAEAIAGLVGLVDAIAPTHWTIIAEPIAEPCRHCGRPARGDAVTSPATGSVAHWCLQCSAEHCELERYLAARPCTECGHQHAGAELAGICIGCACPVRDAGPYPVQANADRN